MSSAAQQGQGRTGFAGAVSPPHRASLFFWAAFVAAPGPPPFSSMDFHAAVYKRGRKFSSYGPGKQRVGLAHKPVGNKADPLLRAVSRWTKAAEPGVNPANGCDWEVVNSIGYGST
jgi:hypothetical protein